MLLNEFLKEHRKVEEQEAAITQVKSNAAKQEATIALQQKEIQALTASLKEQAAQIQKVSAQGEMSRPAPQTVAKARATILSNRPSARAVDSDRRTIFVADAHHGENR
jgi:septal ring factor EnvC (AmiA/AmiB activator)